MQERRVTVDVHTHELARPFLVLATQNPVEYEGTYPLPEAQVDRFMMRLSMGYPSAAGEVAMLAAHEAGDRVGELEPVAGAAELLAAQDAASRVLTSDALRAYVVALLGVTRQDPRVELGASPRAGLMLLRAAKARALLEGRDHALPDDVQALAEPVLAHRIVLAPEALEASGAGVVADALAATPAL
jgi:MoxR-like ATPase